MSNLSIFLYEWKHFVRSPFKVVALLLFAVAAIYGLHNGSHLYFEQLTEVEKIQTKAVEEKQEYLSQYDEGKLVNEDRPWINMAEPFWAIWFSSGYNLKEPSPAMVYSIGQAEQYGFYKKVTFWASPYDTDMAEEIANPERLQTGSLDFAFVLLFLSPLLLLILLYNLQSAEAEQGFLPLVEVQTASKNGWLITRMAFYVVLSTLVIIGLLLYGATLTNVFKTSSNAFGQVLLYSLAYLAFWSVIYFFILKNGKSILGNTLQMIGIWLLFAFIVPGTVHQVIGITQPTNLMTDFINVRDQQQELYAQPDSVFVAELVNLFPKITDTPSFRDSTKRKAAMSASTAAIVNEMKKQSIQPVKNDYQEKNDFITKTFWFNPVSFFQNQFNSIAQTHFDDYETHRQDIQSAIDHRIEVLISDVWNDTKVDKSKYLEYAENEGGK
ncbi:MAG: hypothetical protein AAF573_06280 [Bacteroidota bacterium]